MIFSLVGAARALSLSTLVVLAGPPAQPAARAPQGKSARPKPPPPPKPAPPLPMLPSVGKVHLEVRGDGIVVTQDINLPRGDYRSGALSLYAAFGAPGLPLAVDAKLIALADGLLEADAEAAGDKVDVELSPKASISSNVLLGSGSMAGITMHIAEALFLKDTAKGMAVLRVRTLLTEPEEDAQGTREVVVRLGTAQGQPLALGRIDTDERVNLGSLTATFCGKDAEEKPLAVGRLKKGATTKVRDSLALAPILSTRRPQDDLCVRYTKKK